MKIVSKTMYIIGLIINGLLLLGSIICFAIFNISANASASDIQNAINQSGQTITVAEYQSTMKLTATIFLVLLILEAISFILAILGTILAGKGTLSSVIVHVLMIIFGIIGVNIFYIIGAVFGLVKKEEVSKKV